MRKGSLVPATVLPILLLATMVSAGTGASAAMGKTGAVPIPALESDPFFEQGDLSDKPGASGEGFGEAIAVAGRTLVVGTTHHMAASTDIEQGAAYVFNAPPSGWAQAKQEAILKAPRGQSEEAFGRSVAISDNAIVIGAPAREVGGRTGQGAAYVFIKPASGWSHAAPPLELTAARGQSNEFFGESVAISGDTVIVGAPGRKIGRHAAQGAVDAFALSGSRTAKPAQTAELTASDGNANDAFGISVATSGQTVLAGADLHRVGAVQQGAAYIFVKPAHGWRDARESAKLTAGPGQAGELFGRIVAICHDTAVIGAPNHNGAATEQGAAFVFVKPASGWAGSLTPTAQLAASDPGKGDEFGGALAISDGVIAAGAPSHATGKSTEQGAGYVFVKPTGGWKTATETDELIAANGAEGDKLGLSIAIAGATFLLGAPDHEFNKERAQGVVYTFASGVDELR
jgi:FG-GAP repeat